MAQNTIHLEFDPCEPVPGGGYKIRYRPLGSGGPYRNAPTNFFSSPAVFNDNLDPAGTSYEGFIQGDCGGGKLGVSVPFVAEFTGSVGPSSQAPSSVAPSSSEPPAECPYHIQIVPESLGFNETSCENIKYSLRLVDNLGNPVINTGPNIQVPCHADYSVGDCATPSSTFTAPGPLNILNGTSVSVDFFAATAPDNVVTSFVIDGPPVPDELHGCDILVPE